MVSQFSFWVNSSKPRIPRRKTPPSSKLQEALRRNPFVREASKSVETGGPATQELDREVEGLNHDLVHLSRLFPDVQFDALREMLTRWDGDSRLHVCVEQLLRHGTEYVRGRWQNPSRDTNYAILDEELFRTSEYKVATRRLLSREFLYLNKSTIDGVLAENNYSYTCSRPTLSKLSSRTWRATISNYNIFKRRKESPDDPIYLLDKNVGSEEALGSGCPGLDGELQELFIKPASRCQESRQRDQDHDLAEELNEAEAREAAALYDCECCCQETTFERISTCTTNGHMICFSCIRCIILEALFGQGWKRAIIPELGALRCLAPFAEGACDGYISHSVIRRVILEDKAGAETWAKFEDRLTVECLLRSRLKLVHCPFCSYAEADPSERPDGSSAQPWRVKKTHSITALLLMAISLNILPTVLLMISLLALSRFTTPLHLFQMSLHNISLRQRSPRFRCRNPGCQRTSCLRCQKAWHDPHKCHEPLLLSLRTTVEAARTAAIKRTCPRCGLSFVKSSGCNKLTCVCGYSMCYLCRTAIEAPSAVQDHARGRRNGDYNMEGYRHFCEHFRVNPGSPCTECRKCDLYRSENEDAIVRRAGQEAEQQWRLKEGMVGVEGLVEMTGDRQRTFLRTVMSGGWSWQEILDWIVGSLIEVDF